MSTIDDLRNELADRAADVPPGQHLDRLAGIQRKRTAQRRTMAASAAGATALAVAAVVALVPGNADRAEPTPPATEPTRDSSLPVLPGAPVPVVEEKGVEFYETPGQGTLGGYAVGEQGEREVRFSFVSGSDVLALNFFCFGVPTGASRAEKLWVDLSVNGQVVGQGECSGPQGETRRPFFSYGDSFDDAARSWRALGVQMGSRVHVVLELVDGHLDGEPAHDSAVVLGAAFWAQSDDEHQVTPTVTVPDVVEYEGVNYQYVASDSATVGDGGRVRAPALASGSRQPVLVRWGFMGSGGSFTLYPGGAGDPAGVSAVEGRGGSEHFLPFGDTAGVRLVAERVEEDEVTLWVAVYAPIR